MFKYHPIRHMRAMTAKGMRRRDLRIHGQQRGKLLPNRIHHGYWNHRHGDLRESSNLNTSMILGTVPICHLLPVALSVDRRRQYNFGQWDTISRPGHIRAPRQRCAGTFKLAPTDSPEHFLSFPQAPTAHLLSSRCHWTHTANRKPTGSRKSCRLPQ